MKLSIITVNLNNLAGLKKTIQSVFEQTFTDYEYIIIDGGSTDGSKEYIEQVAQQDLEGFAWLRGSAKPSRSNPISYWVSEKDGGVYEAMNKGIEKAKGEYLMFLNSGDFLSEENVLSNTHKIISEHESADIYYGNMEIQRGGENIPITHPQTLTVEHLAHHTINHQAAYIKNSVFSRFGLYDLNYRMASDHAFFLKALVNGASFMHIPYEMIYYDMNGASSTNWKGYSDEMEIARQKEIPEEFNKMKAELLDYRKLMNQRIIKCAVRLNRYYQNFRRRMK